MQGASFSVKGMRLFYSSIYRIIMKTRMNQFLMDKEGDQSMSQTIFTNGTIYTLNHQQPTVESVVVENGKIIDLGSHEDMLLQWGRSGTKTIDLQGNIVTPGMIDSHMHLSGVAFNFLELNLTGVTSKSEMLRLIKERAKTVPEGKWLIGIGWDENAFEHDCTIPTLQELDYVAPNCPIFIKRICYHAFLVNSRALEIANYHPSIPVSKGGQIGLDPVTKEPTGLILESASNLFTKHIPERSYEELKQGLKQAVRVAIKSGLTSVHTNDPVYFGGLDQTYSLYNEVINNGPNKLRCNLLVDYEFLKEIKEKEMYTGFGNEHVQIGAIKFFEDGAFGRRTALLSEPYHDEPGQYGEAMQDQETLFHMFKEVREYGMPIAVHTIGDQALKNVLDILDQIPKGRYRDRIIHTSLIQETLLPRLENPSLVADIQPRFVVSDYPWITERLGKKREKDLYAWKKMLSAGVICAGGSDAPVEPFEPLLGLHAAVTRRLPTESHSGWNEKEKLTMMEAVQLFTLGGAYATNEEHHKGTLTRGKLADMTVFSKDLFKLEDPDELLNTDVVMTIIAGEVQDV